MKSCLFLLGLWIPLFFSLPAHAVKDWRPLLKSIVNINSGTQNIEGLESVRQILIPEFKKIGYGARVLEGKKDIKLLFLILKTKHLSSF